MAKFIAYPGMPGYLPTLYISQYKYIWKILKIFLILSSSTLHSHCCISLKPTEYVFLYPRHSSVPSKTMTIVVEMERKFVLLSVIFFLGNSKIIKPMNKWICDYCAMGKGSLKKSNICYITLNKGVGWDSWCELDREGEAEWAGVPLRHCVSCLPHWLHRHKNNLQQVRS